MVSSLSENSLVNILRTPCLLALPSCSSNILSNRSAIAICLSVILNKVISPYRAPTGTTRNPILRVTRYEEMKQVFIRHYKDTKKKDSSISRNPKFVHLLIKRNTSTLQRYEKFPSVVEGTENNIQGNEFPYQTTGPILFASLRAKRMGDPLAHLFIFYPRLHNYKSHRSRKSNGQSNGYS